MIKRESNPRKQGDAGLGTAIGWFATHEYTVAVPLTDSQHYDLIVDDGEKLQRVFVRTTTQKSEYGIYECGLRTQGGNKSQFKIRKFDNTKVELLFIATAEGAMYLIPANVVTNKSAISLGEKYAAYKLSLGS